MAPLTGFKRDSTMKEELPSLLGPDTKKKSWAARLVATAEFRGGLALLVLAVALPLVVFWSLSEAVDIGPSDVVGTCSISDAYRVSCLPGRTNATSSECVSAGCCFSSGECFHSLPTSHNYNAAQWSSREAALAAAESESGLRLQPTRVSTPLGATALSFNVFVRTIDAKSLSILLTTSQETIATSTFPLTDCSLGVEIEGPQFSFAVFRREDNSTIFLSTEMPIIFSETYREISLSTRNGMKFAGGSLLPSNGETTRYLYAGPGRPLALPSLWLLDDNGQASVMSIQNQDSPIEVSYVHGSSVLTVRGLAPGSWNLRVFSGPTPSEAATQLYLSNVASVPAVPPIWALGLHICPHHDNLESARNMLTSLQDFPWDSTCLWDSVLGLSLGNSSIRPLENISSVFNSSLLSGRQVVVSVPPAACLTCGVPEAGLVLSENGSNVYTGTYLGETIVYPDWMNTDALQWFRTSLLEQLQPLSDREILGGVVLRRNWPLDETIHPSENVDYLPSGEPLSSGTLWWQAKHSAGQVPHYQVHGSLQVFQAEFLKESVPLVLSDAAVPGILGATLPYESDSQSATWNDLYLAIEDAQLAGLGGVPLANPTLCAGTAQLPDEDLCLRWIQAASLMPVVSVSRDLFNASMNSSSALSYMRSALEFRYRLMPYLYSCLAESVESGIPMVRPAWFHDPTEEILQDSGRTDQFWVGSSLLVAPVVLPASYFVSVRLPRANFFHLMGMGENVTGYGEAITMQSLRGELLILLREGHIVPIQESGSNAVETRTTNLTLVAAVSCSNDSVWNCSAEGKIRVSNASLPDPWLYISVFTSNEEDSIIVDLTLRNLLGTQSPDCEQDVPIIDTVRVLGLPEQTGLFMTTALGIQRCQASADIQTYTFNATDSITNMIGVRLS